MEPRLGEIFDRAWQLNVPVLIRAATPQADARYTPKKQF